MSTHGGGPAVSVVTPFYNTALYLAECIESVLAQSHDDWEYVLVDNRSTDGSRDIAQRYADRDQRIRLSTNDAFLTQVQNYNHALSLISETSRYCKIVQADDWIFPDCLRRMVDVAERSPSVAIVSCYAVAGTAMMNVGLPYPSPVVRGRDVCRKTLLEGGFYFGTPTTVLFRTDIVRSRRPFYSEGRLHEDTEACYEILREWDFGFVHEVLAFCRTENESITSRARDLKPIMLDAFITLDRYGPDFLTPPELARRTRERSRQYFGGLGEAFLRRREPAFWEHHRKGLRTIGRELRTLEILPWALLAAARMVLNPLHSVESLVARLRRRREARSASEAQGA